VLENIINAFEKYVAENAYSGALLVASKALSTVSKLPS